MTTRRALVVCVLALLIAACSPWTPFLITPPDATGVSPCDPGDTFFYTWNYGRLDDLSTQVDRALAEAGLYGARGYAQAYGEDKRSASSGAYCGFLTLETDFTITLPVQSLTDPQVLAPRVLALLAVLDAFPPEETPGPRPGYISIVLVHRQERARMRFSVMTAAEAREHGLTGAALLQALGYQPEQ